MISLYKYISYINKKQDKTIIDCHVHSFGRGEYYTYPQEYPINGCICMVENPLKYPERPLIDDFKIYISEGEVTDRKKLLCVGKDAVETAQIYNIYKNKISGWGEIKCYKRCKDSKGNILKRYDTSILQSILDMSESKLPIFIHWDLDGERDEELYNIIKDHPAMKFVLCHCGINNLNNPEKSFQTAVRYQSSLPNLWLSISWDALGFFINKNNEVKYDKLSLLPDPYRVLVGTDFNPEDNSQGISFRERYYNFIKIYDNFNVPMALNNLFS